MRRDRHVLAEQRLRLRQVAALAQQLAEVAQAGAGLAVDVAVNLPADRERLAQQRLGIGGQPAVHVGAAQLDQRDRDFRVLVAQHLTPHRQRFLEERDAPLPVLVAQLDAEIVQALRDARRARAIGFAGACERLFEHRPRLVVQPEALIDAADLRHDVGLQLGPAGQFPLHARRAGVEQFPHGRFALPRAIGIRIGRVEQVRS